MGKMDRILVLTDTGSKVYRDLAVILSSSKVVTCSTVWLVMQLSGRVPMASSKALVPALVPQTHKGKIVSK